MTPDGATASVSTPALSVVGVSKTFGETCVLRHADLALAPGEIRALVGENGSGKSTLVKILAGYHAPDPGSQVLVGGEPLSFGHPEDSARAGLRFVHQDLGLVGMLDCVDNMSLGHGFPVGRTGGIRWAEAAEAARVALRQLDHEIDVRRTVDTMSIAERTALAIARALSPQSGQARVLILDEPTANLPVSDVERLFTLLRRIRDSGVALLFISHHFNEVFDLADSVTVLRDGAMIATRKVSELDHDTLVELMIGRRLETAQHSHRHDAGGPAALRLQGVSGRVIHGLDLEVAAGEIVGVAGVTGSGREELAGLITGQLNREGVVTVNGRDLTPMRPDLTLGSGMAFVPAERHANAVLHEHSLRENITISDLSPYMFRGFFRRSRERSDVTELLSQLDVRPRDPDAPIASLSGGNQQKVMIARALRLRPNVLVLDEPTQGVDIGAQAEIHRLLREAVNGGLAALVCSSTSEELAEIADRVVVMNGGDVVAVLKGPLDPDQITAAVLKKREAVAA